MRSSLPCFSLLRGLRGTAVAFLAAALAACAGSSDDSTDQDTGALTGPGGVGGDAPLTAQNYKTNPKIIELDKLATDSEAAQMTVRQLNPDFDCPDGEFQRDGLTRVGGAKIDRMNTRLGLHGSLFNHLMYFDAAGRLRVIKVIELRNGTDFIQNNIYFDEKSTRFFEVVLDQAVPNAPGKVVDDKNSVLPTVLKDTVFVDASGKQLPDALTRTGDVMFHMPMCPKAK